MQRLLAAMLVLAPISSAALAKDPQPQTSGQTQVEMARSAERPAIDQKRVLAREEMDQVTAGFFVRDSLDRTRSFYGHGRAFSRGVIEDFDDSF